MGKRVRAVVALLVSLVLLSSVVSGCGQQAAPAKPAEPAKPATPPTVVIGLGGDPKFLNPLYSNDGTSLPVTCSMFQPLVLGGENWGLELKGELAEKYETKDGLTYTFTLRKDVKWHDGKPFTSADVVFTMSVVQDKKNNTQWHDSQFVDNQPIKWEAPDPYTVKATLPKKSASFLSHMSIPIIAKHIYENEKDIEHSQLNQKPIGTGPFKFVEWKTGERVVLSANADFYKGKPQIERLIFQIIPNADSAIVALQTGQIDLLNAAWNKVEKLKSDPNLVVASQPRDHILHLLYNCGNPIFADKKVRQALAFALDKKALVDTMFLGYGEPADSPFTKATFVYVKDDPTLPKYNFNLEQAKKMLAEAGWKAGADGILTKNGKPMKFELVTWTGSYATLLPVLQAQLKAVGADVSVRTLDAPAFTSALTEKKYDLALNGMGVFGRDPDSYTSIYARPKADHRQNWEDARVMDLFRRARIEVNEAERKNLYKQAEKILLEEIPLVPIGYSNSVQVYNKRLDVEAAKLNVNRFPVFENIEKLAIKK